MPDSTEHKAVFKPRARLLELLGDQLIRHHRIALFELVKNSYDADSPSVDVLLQNIQNREKALIEIRDSGEGMDLETVLNIWLEPASDHKANRRKQSIRTPRFKRLPVGEKGVGRFAVQKLGKHALLVTRREGHREIVLEMDWKALVKNHYLSDATVTVTEREPEIFKDDSHGTLIKITGIKNDWTRGDIRRVYRAITAMVSPFATKDRFDVRFRMAPDKGLLDDLFSAEKARESALFYFEFNLSDDGLEWEYCFTPYESLKAEYPALIKERAKRATKDESFEFFRLAPPEEDKGWKKRGIRRERISLNNSGIGSVRGRLLVFDLDREIKMRLHDVQGLTQFLKEQGGVRVYRDGMRVYDYGEPENDWLGLDVRRVQKPAKLVSNNLILGEIHLDLSASSSLLEKTNREGFVENDAYKEFRYAVMCILTVLEAERRIDKDVLRQAFKARKENESTGIDSPESAIDELRKKVVDVGMAEKLGTHVNRVEKAYKEAREILMSAVGAGLGLSLVFHEIERGVRGLVYALETGQGVQKVMEMARQLAEMLEGASFLVRKSEREALKASDLFRYVSFSSKPRCEYHKIKLLNGFDNLPDKDFSITGSRRMLTATLTNLIDNAIHWINVSADTDEQQRCVWVGPSYDLEGATIVVADSGPGFQDPMEEVVKPFFTRRLEGMGLGLYYADMAMKAHNGRLAFPEHADVDIPKACDGAVVAMVFPGKEKK
ncbi:MAG: ATP-binding protein [Candidatus Thiodiazotropha sp. (ex Dulcina madagascariensis)]|nr:ATP-binding protein [Candidatus Thiodiazotropha sp. (ex Dulcina madagascariensis)]